jgi:hypothetical protein
MREAPDALERGQAPSTAITVEEFSKLRAFVITISLSMCDWL